MRKEITPIQQQWLVDHRLAPDTTNTSPTIIINNGGQPSHGVYVSGVGSKLARLIKNLCTGLVVAVVVLSVMTKTRPSEGLAMIESKVIAFDVVATKNQALQFIGF